MTFQRIEETQRNKMKTHAGVIGGGGGRGKKQVRPAGGWLFSISGKKIKETQNITFKRKSFQFHSSTKWWMIHSF
jgi:hypothetical protein